MHTLWPRLLGTLCGIAFLSVTAHAADIGNLRYSAKVKVSVSATENIKGSVSSYLNRELRSLSDVELVDNKPEWEIIVIAMELMTVGNYKTGIALSTVVIRSFRNEMLSGLFEPKFKDTGLTLTSELFWYPHPYP